MRNHTEPALNTDLHSAIKLLRGGYTLKPVVQCVNWDTCFDEGGRGSWLENLPMQSLPFTLSNTSSHRAFCQTGKRLLKVIDRLLIFVLLYLLDFCCYWLLLIVVIHSPKMIWYKLTRARLDGQTQMNKILYTNIYTALWKTHLSKIRWAKTAKNWRLSQVLPRLVTLLPEKIIIVF